MKCTSLFELKAVPTDTYMQGLTRLHYCIVLVAVRVVGTGFLPPLLCALTRSYRCALQNLPSSSGTSVARGVTSGGATTANTSTSAPTALQETVGAVSQDAQLTTPAAALTAAPAAVISVEPTNDSEDKEIEEQPQVAGPERRSSAAGSSPGRTWLPPSFSSSRPAASSGLSREELPEEEQDGVGTSTVEQRRPFLGGTGRGPEGPSVSRTQNDERPVSATSSLSSTDGPPRLASSSGDER